MAMLDILIEQLAVRGITVEYRGGDNLALVGDTSKADKVLMDSVKMFKKDLLHRFRGEPVPSEQRAKPHPGPKSELCSKCDATVFRPGLEIGLLCQHGNLCPYFRRPRPEQSDAG